MRSAGVELRYDSTHWGAMGTYEALKLAPKLLWVLSRVKRDLLARRPSVLVLIDFGAFNARAAAWALSKLKETTPSNTTPHPTA